MIQWEYKVRYINGLTDAHNVPGTIKEHEILKEQGKEGWELCSVHIDSFGRYYYFKRQITDN